MADRNRDPVSEVNPLKNQAYNPFLPPWEYIPDGEPRIFGDRLYLFGSHDKFGGKWYCENDYVGWSAPLNDLSDWRYEGVIFTKEQDSRKGNLYAPDVVQGLDGRFYLYYSKDDTSVIGVAVCDTPAGKYEFYGEVSYPDGKVVGDSGGEYFMFDPAVLIDDGRVWLYSGSSQRSTTTKIKRNMAGCTVMELEADMKTVKQNPKVILPGARSWMTDAYFEGPSVRKIGTLYYIVYPVRNASGLHYATSKYPDRDFIHRGSIHSTSDIGLNGHTVQNPAYPTGNNHGGMVEIDGKWYIFDHRQTNNTGFSRQAVAEPVTIEADGTIRQAEATSCGLNGRSLNDEGIYPAYIACNLMGKKILPGLQWPFNKPYVTQSGSDGDKDADFYIAGMKNGCTAGFKYFDFAGGSYQIKVTYRHGGGKLTLSLQESGAVIASADLPQWQNWHTAILHCQIPQGKHALFFHFSGKHSMDMLQFEIKRTEEVK